MRAVQKKYASREKGRRVDSAVVALHFLLTGQVSYGIRHRERGSGLQQAQGGRTGESARRLLVALQRAMPAADESSCGLDSDSDSTATTAAAADAAATSFGTDVGSGSVESESGRTTLFE